MQVGQFVGQKEWPTACWWAGEKGFTGMSLWVGVEDKSFVGMLVSEREWPPGCNASWEVFHMRSSACGMCSCEVVFSLCFPPLYGVLPEAINNSEHTKFSLTQNVVMRFIDADLLASFCVFGMLGSWALIIGMRPNRSRCSGSDAHTSHCSLVAT